MSLEGEVIYDPGKFRIPFEISVDDSGAVYVAGCSS